MAVASIMVGVLVGIVSFFFALLAGQGVIGAVGYYVMGGFIATCVLLLASYVRGLVSSEPQSEQSVALRS